MYTGIAEFAILDYAFDYQKIEKVLKNFCDKAESKSTEFLRDTIVSCVPKKGENAKIPDQIYVEGLPK